MHCANQIAVLAQSQAIVNKNLYKIYKIISDTTKKMVLIIIAVE